MNPIDQIRKALEAFYEVNDDLKHSNEDAAEALKRFERAILPMHIAALLASHDAAVQRAAEMQELLTILKNRLVWDGYGYWLPDLCVKEKEFGEEFCGEPTNEELAAAIRAIKE